MRSGSTGLAKAALVFTLLLPAAFIISCGGTPSTGPTTSGLNFRAFVSNPLFPLQSGGGVPVLNIVDASTDMLSASRVSFSSIPSAGMMAVSPDRQFTLVLSPTNNQIAVVQNSIEATFANASGTVLSPIQLPGTTESFVVSSSGQTAYVAVPGAIVTGQPLGALVAFNYTTGITTATVPVASAHFVMQSHDGNTLLVFSDNSNCFTSVSTSLIGTATDPRTTICGSGLDRPVWGVFSSDDSTAYIFNCGPECGGVAASITVFSLNDNSLGANIPVDAATNGLLNGNTLYVAGTPPSDGANTCEGSNTSATSCGRFTTVDVTALTKTGSAIIADGYHNRMELGANGQVFVGARSCTNLTSGEIRGCLSIVNTNGPLSATVPPAVGDVTGIQPITNRNVVYVCQNGALYIYDTTTDQLQSTQINIIGQATDVKLVDGPP